jgi:hypothetical protein
VNNKDDTMESDITDAMQEVPETEHPDGCEMQEWVFTNDKTNPAPRGLFRLIHMSAFQNKLGIMHALDPDSNKVVTLIVGVDQNEQGSIVCWPLAKILTEEEQKAFKSPDGSGNYI